MHFIDKLDPRTRRFIDEARAAGTPSVSQIPVGEARENMRARQGDVAIPPTIQHSSHISPHCQFEFLRPVSQRDLPFPIMDYFHGGGWALGDFDTHKQLACDLVLETGAALAFPLYDRSPEVRFPQAVEQCHAFSCWLAERSVDFEIDPRRMALVGDSAGGTLAATVANLAAQRGAPDLCLQALLYPVIEANFETNSYQEFATGFNLEATAMHWYWEQYAPLLSDRLDPRASPIHTPSEVLRRSAPALVITAECDVLRDEGEAYARRLMHAGVETFAWRALGTVHSFLLAKGLRDSPVTRSGMFLLATQLRKAFGLTA
jgi:acetyl esterase